MELITMKTSSKALHMLRLIAAVTGETQAGVMERLFRDEGRLLRIERLFDVKGGRRLPVLPKKKENAR